MLISFIISIVPATSVILMLILVKEMCGVWLLISHASHLLLGQIPPVIITGPVTWTGLLSFFAPRATVFLLICAMVVHRSCHINIEREIQLTPRGVAVFYHVDAGKWVCVYFHGELPKDQTALFYRRLDLAT